MLFIETEDNSDVRNSTAIDQFPGIGLTQK